MGNLFKSVSPAFGLDSRLAPIDLPSFCVLIDTLIGSKNRAHTLGTKPVKCEMFVVVCV